MLAENSKYVEGYDQCYSITTDGRIYRHSYVDKMGRLLKGRWLKPFIDAGGYITPAYWKYPLSKWPLLPSGRAMYDLP